MRIYNLSKSARDEVIGKLPRTSGLEDISIRSKDLKIAEPDGGDQSLAIIFDKDEKIYLGRSHKDGKEAFFPLLKDEMMLPKIPTITVDSGAVKFVCNGANIMRPGITKIEGDFAKSDLVLVREQKYGKAIAVGRSMLPKGELEALTKGPVIENLHYVGDKYWEALKEIEGSGS